MSLPDSLLAAIIRTTDDEAAQEDLARRWQRALRRGARAEARIRKQIRAARCSCEVLAELTEDGRCSRCFGWPLGEAADGGGRDGGERRCAAT